MISGLDYLHGRKIVHRGSFSLEPLASASTILTTSSSQTSSPPTSLSRWTDRSSSVTLASRASSSTAWLAPGSAPSSISVLNASRAKSTRATFFSPLPRRRTDSLPLVRMNADVWSMALTVLEVALNRYPFPSRGEAPIVNPVELLMYLAKMDQPYLEDEPGIKYTNAFRDFIQIWCVLAFVAWRSRALPALTLSLLLCSPQSRPESSDSSYPSKAPLAWLDQKEYREATSSRPRSLGTRLGTGRSGLRLGRHDTVSHMYTFI
jgi:serine/threonine protein kinase